MVQAQGRLFASFLLEEAWLKRYLRLTSPQAREAARLFAFFQLVELRRDAALTLVHKEHLARGAFPVDDAVPRLADALVGPGFPFRKGDNFQRYREMCEQVMPRCAGLRRPGAAADYLYGIGLARLAA